MFGNLGWGEIAVIVLLALFLLGPDRLPTAVRDGARMLRKLRAMAHDATQDFREQLGPDVELEDLHPKRLLRRHLLSEEQEEELRQPFRQALGDDDYRKVLQRMRGQAGLDPRVGDVDDENFDINSLNSRHPMFGLGSGDGERSSRKPQFDPDAT